MEALKTTKPNGRRVFRRSQRVYLDTITDIVSGTQYKFPPVGAKPKRGKRIKSLSVLRTKTTPVAIDTEEYKELETALARKASKVAADIRASLTPVARSRNQRTRVRPRSLALGKQSPAAMQTVTTDPSPRKQLSAVRQKVKSPLQRLLEEEVFSLLNQVRASPEAFERRLEEYLTELRNQQQAPKSAGRSSEELITAIDLVEKAARACTGLHETTRLHLSSGLCQAARDMVCNLGTFGFIAPVEISLLDAPDVREALAVSSSFYPKYGSLKQLPVLENFAYSFENAVEALCTVFASRTRDVHGDPKSLTSGKVRVAGVAAGVHQSMKNCLVVITCGNYFEKQRIPPTMQSVTLRTESEFYPLGLGKALMKVGNRQKSEVGGEAVRALAQYVDAKGCKLSEVFEDSGEEISRKALESTLSRLMGASQAQWLSLKLSDNQRSVPITYVENTFSYLRTRIFKENELTKSLLRVKTLIQDTLRMSVMEAFHRMVPADTSRADVLTKDQIKAGLTTIGCYLPYHEVLEMLCAFDCTHEGFITAHNWVSVLCGVKPAQKKAATSPKAGSPRFKPLKAISLTGNSLQTCQAFSANASIFDQRLSSRPSTAGSFATLQRNLSSAVSNPISEESGFISNASLSNASSMQPVMDSQAIMQCEPGPRLVQVAKLLTNFSNPVTPIDEEKQMRSLGSHVYSGPGRHHEVLGKVDAGGVVTVSKISGPWAKIVIDSLEGWVPLQHLDSTLDRHVYSGKDNEVQSFPATEAKAVAAVYLRKDPAWDGKAIKKLKPNETTEVLGASNQWLKVVTSSGYKGWIPQPATNVSAIRAGTADSWTRTSGMSGTRSPQNSQRRTELQQWLEDLHPTVLPKDSQALVEARVSAKMAAIGETQYQHLGTLLKKKTFREKLIRNWMNLAITRAFK